MAWSVIEGQSTALEMLQAHLRQGRVASAYLFVGPAGVGKQLTAIELAKAINCATGGADACGAEACDSCRRIDRQVHPDIHRMSPEGAAQAIRIETIREVLGRIALRPFMARRQVVLIDGADRLTDEAANALLKMLEEPPSQAMFILLAGQTSACLPTVVSRCHVIRFQRLPDRVIEQRLVTEGQSEAQARSIARLASGSLASAGEIREEWDAYAAILERLACADASSWLGWTAPTDRKELARWIACSIARLRETAVTAAASDADAFDPERCVETAVSFIELAEALEQMANARLVGTLLRERWMDLLETSRGVRSSKLEVRSAVRHNV